MAKYNFEDVDFARSNEEIARELGCSLSMVLRERLCREGKKTQRGIDFSGVDLTRPVHDIAKELGCSRHTVTMARRRAGVARHRDIDFTGADWNKTNPEIAREFHCTVWTVWHARNRLRIPQRPRGYPQKKDDTRHPIFPLKKTLPSIDLKAFSSPSELLRDMTKKYPNAGRTADVFRSERGTKKPNWPLWCFLPLRGVMLIAAPGMRTLTLDQQFDLIPLAAALAWRPGQDIVRFDRDVYDALGKTPLADDVPDDIFLRLPAWSLYIELYHEAWHGVFVHLDYNTRTKGPELRMLFLPKEPAMLMPVVLPLGRGSISAGFQAFQNEAERNLDSQADAVKNLYASLSASMREENTAAELLHTNKLVQHVLSLVLYLCSEHPEWKTTEKQEAKDRGPHPAEPKKVKSGWRLFPPDHPRIWTVGEETGIRIRAARSDKHEAHAGPRPHIRRAHWHSYWTGKKVWKEGETPIPQKVVVKWLPPIPVALGEEDK